MRHYVEAIEKDGQCLQGIYSSIGGVDLGVVTDWDCGHCLSYVRLPRTLEQLCSLTREDAMDKKPHVHVTGSGHR